MTPYEKINAVFAALDKYPASDPQNVFVKDFNVLKLLYELANDTNDQDFAIFVCNANSNPEFDLIEQYKFLRELIKKVLNDKLLREQIIDTNIGLIKGLKIEQCLEIYEEKLNIFQSGFYAILDETDKEALALLDQLRPLQEARGALSAVYDSEGKDNEKLDALRIIHIQAMAKNNKEIVNDIRVFLKNNPQLNLLYQHRIIETKLTPSHIKPIEYLHNRINIDHLHPSNKKLLTDEQTRIIKEKIKNKNVLETKEGFGYKIVKLINKDGKEVICALYPPPLGTGTFGEVFLAQNLDTNLQANDWLAVKIQKPSTKEDVAKIRQEINSHSDVKQFIGSLDITKDDAEIPEQIVMGIKLAEGVELEDVIMKPTSFLSQVSANVWLSMGSDLLNAYREQVWAPPDNPDSAQIHRDIKLRNILINPATGLITFIDRGMARKKINGQVIDKGPIGTPGYIAPEIMTGSNGQYIFNEKTEIFALGISLLEFYKFLFVYDAIIPEHRQNGVRHYENFDDPKVSEAMARFPNTVIRDAVHAFLKRMVALNPADRPSLEECQEFFDIFKNLKLNSANAVKNIAIFDINEYRRADKAEKHAIAAQLKKADEVWLMDSAPQITPSGYPKDKFEYIKIVAELQNEGVLVGQKLFTQPDSGKSFLRQLELIDQVKKGIEHDPDYANKVLRYTFVTAETSGKAFKEELEKIKVAHNYADTRFINSELITIGQLKKIIDALRQDIWRLENAYKDNAQVKMRVIEIQNLKQDLEAYGNGTLSIAEAVMKLTVLQQSMNSTSVVSSLLEEWSSTSPFTKSLELIEKLKSEISQPEPHEEFGKNTLKAGTLKG